MIPKAEMGIDYHDGYERGCAEGHQKEAVHIYAAAQGLRNATAEIPDDVEAELRRPPSVTERPGSLAHDASRSRTTRCNRRR